MQVLLFRDLHPITIPGKDFVRFLDLNRDSFPPRWSRVKNYRAGIRERGNGGEVLGRKMTDRGPLYDQSDTPEDVATLYSWANLHGAKYRDFSEARAQTRENARQRVQQAIEEEQARLQKQAQAERAIEVPHRADPSRLEEEDRQAEWAAQRAAQIAVQHAAELEATQQAMQQALAAQQAQAVREAQAAREAQAMREAQAAVHRAAQLKAQRAAEEAAIQSAIAERAIAEQAAEKAAERAAEERIAAEQAAAEKAAAEQAAAVKAAAEQAAAELAKQRAQAASQISEKVQQSKPQQVPQRPVWPPMADRFAGFVTPEAESPSERHPEQPAAQHVPPPREYPGYQAPLPSWPGTAPAQPVASRETAARQESFEAPVSSWPQGEPEQRETPARPAWLTPERPETPTPAAPPARPAEDTLQGSRDRLASRWYALRGVFDGPNVQPEAAPAAPPARAPAVAVFSLAGGVGKTSLVATLGRALSSRGERVLLVDTAPYGLMPFFFGAHDQRPGVLRTFSPPGTSGDAPIQMVTIDPDPLAPEAAAPEELSAEISKYSRGVSRVIVDLATASGATTRRVLKMSPLVLVPMIPDMNSVVSVSSIDSFFQHNVNPNSKQVMPFYVLNQFDSSLPLHLDIREMLREQLGRSSAAVCAAPRAGGKRGTGRRHDGDGLRSQLHRG